VGEIEGGVGGGGVVGCGGGDWVGVQPLYILPFVGITSVGMELRSESCLSPVGMVSGHRID